MTAELAVIDGETEVAEHEPLTKTQAKALDKKIRTTSDRVQKNLDKADEEFDSLLDLIAEASEGEIHKGLGIKSWTAWVKDAVQIQVSSREERQHVASILGGKGLSTRAIAGMVGADQKTISNDLRETGATEENSSVVGLDGREYKNSKKEAEPEVIDAEVVEDPESKPTTAIVLVGDFHDETVNLWNATSVLKELLTEELWDKARRRASKADLNDIQTVIEDLGNIVDDLMSVE
jgi:hypothetical protein